MDYMKAVVFHGNDDLRFESVPRPQIINPGDALVRVTTSTICGSDIHIKHHGETMGVKPGNIIGHEFVGIVEQVGGQVSNFKTGDRVAVACVFSCGECFYCQKGIHSQCPQGSVFGGSGKLDNRGAHAEYVRVPFASRVMHKIPDTLSDEDVLFVGDILSTGYYGAERGEIKAGDTVVVIGSGPVGMCAMISARLFGAEQIIAVDLDNHRLGIALNQGIADKAINPQSEEPLKVIKDLTDNRGADVVIEAVGSKTSFEAAFRYIRPGGTVSLLGVYTMGVDFPINQHWRRNLSVKMGLVEVTHMNLLIELIKDGQINTNFLISHVLPFTEIMKGYELFENRVDNALKVVLKG
ncbi:alcohol dehydrogenase [Desulfosporosinus youngiae]|uniref:Theronine dehydrogenase-like Zn-dependent dehydrogenase n=1 Tax=Desulfosporosinus youngiae DSM 17734 TaxID=768710 RepID=H5XUX7_9FIRM|nr:alcohol dehydrogenase [Desulfosporosinus youngiae]EHQ89429.1 theronine dehydrogenase-like Zn-dependent dehydrogenase [Desulfosporosinus youngiae DSM 17734]